MKNEIINKLVQNIIDGKIVSFPTETVYALSCNANNINTINKIYKLKNRPKNKLFSVFVDINFLDDYVVYDNDLKDFIFNELNNGTTIIFDKKNDTVLPYIESNTVGIRFPKHNFTRLLLKKLGNFPIVATSVNKSGEEPFCNYSEIIKQFKGIDFIVDGALLCDVVCCGKSSKIVSVAGGCIEIVRE